VLVAAGVIAAALELIDADNSVTADLPLGVDAATNAALDNCG
jgi:hypothetical protein